MKTSRIILGILWYHQHNHHRYHYHYHRPVVVVIIIRELKQRRGRRRRLRKRHLKSQFPLLQTLSRLFHLVQFVKCWHFFLALNSKRLYQSSGKEKESHCLVFTSSTKREIRYFYVAVVRWRQRNVQKSVMHVQSCCFAYLNLLLFCRSRWRRRCRCLSSLLPLRRRRRLHRHRHRRWRRRRHCHRHLRRRRRCCRHRHHHHHHHHRRRCRNDFHQLHHHVVVVTFVMSFISDVSCTLL